MRRLALVAACLVALGCAPAGSGARRAIDLGVGALGAAVQCAAAALRCRGESHCRAGIAVGCLEDAIGLLRYGARAETANAYRLIGGGVTNYAEQARFDEARRCIELSTCEDARTCLDVDRTCLESAAVD